MRIEFYQLIVSPGVLARRGLIRMSRLESSRLNPGRSRRMSLLLRDSVNLILSNWVFLELSACSLAIRRHR